MILKIFPKNINNDYKGGSVCADHVNFELNEEKGENK